jgi:hypothetical protein
VERQEKRIIIKITEGSRVWERAMTQEKRRERWRNKDRRGQ